MTLYEAITRHFEPGKVYQGTTGAGEEMTLKILNYGDFLLQNEDETKCMENVLIENKYLNIDFKEKKQPVDVKEAMRAYGEGRDIYAAYKGSTYDWAYLVHNELASRIADIIIKGEWYIEDEATEKEHRGKVFQITLGETVPWEKLALWYCNDPSKHNDWINAMWRLNKNPIMEPGKVLKLQKWEG